VQTEDLNGLIKSVYSAIGKAQPVLEAEYFLNRMILSARNDNVNNVNSCILGRFPRQEGVFYSADAVEQEAGADKDPTHNYPVKYLWTLKPAGLPPGKLHLKVGSPLLLLCNLAPKHGLCNGTQVILQDMGSRVLQVQIIGGEHHGEIAFIPRILLTLSNNNGQYVFKLKH
jgi:hypothetical protein